MRKDEPNGRCAELRCGSVGELMVQITKHPALAVRALAKRRVIFAIALEAAAPESMLWEQWHAKHEPEPISCMQL
jgi:hypothetical protein